MTETTEYVSSCCGRKIFSGHETIYTPNGQIVSRPRCMMCGKYCIPVSVEKDVSTVAKTRDKNEREES